VVVYNRPGYAVQDRINLFTLDFLNRSLETDRPSYAFSGSKLRYTINGERLPSLAAGIADLQAAQQWQQPAWLGSATLGQQVEDQPLASWPMLQSGIPGQPAIVQSR
jgi:hypothetical protein